MPPSSSSQRERRWTRFRRRFKVTLSQGAAFTVDVCGGGFCALMLRAIPPGTSVEGTILVEGQALPYKGRVIWAKAGDVHLGVRSRVGVGFASVDATFPGLLREH
jgi:hypothetical protein